MNRMKVMDSETEAAFFHLYNLAQEMSEQTTYIMTIRKRLCGSAMMFLLTIFVTSLLHFGFIKYFVYIFWSSLLLYYTLFRKIWRGNGYNVWLLDGVMLVMSVLCFFMAQGLLRLLAMWLAIYGITLPL